MFDELHNPPNTEFADGAAAPEGLAPAVGEASETFEAPLSAPTRSRTAISKSTWAMVGLFVAGVTVVALLSMRSGPAKANATDRDVEKRVDQFIALSQQQQEQGMQSFQDSKKVVDDFYHFASRHQVPVDDLQSNPFVFGKGPSQEATGDTGALSPKRRAELDKEIAKLKLQSVLMGPRGGTAIINSTLVGVGHKVGPFIVVGIGPQAVNLACEGVTFTLRLQQ